MKKFLSLLLALTLVVGMLSAFTVSAAVNTTVFYNALTNEPITSLDGVDGQVNNVAIPTGIETTEKKWANYFGGLGITAEKWGENI